MKKSLLLVSLSVLIAACAAPPTNQPVAPANTNVSSQSRAVAMTETGAIANEKAIWDAIKNKEYDAFGSMVATDQVEVMGEGVMDKASSIAGVKDFEPTEINLSDWKFLNISDDAYLIVYSTNVKGKYKGKEFPAEPGRASSAWVNRDGKWVAIYHQECAVKPPMTAPPAKMNASAKANTNSSAKPESTSSATPAMAAAGDDPIANEKMVWDLFKSKKYDDFAALLAPDFIEVEPDKVYDKAGSVESVKMFDASTSTLSDFKTVSLNDDASLVTYTVKVTGGKGLGERHSTIWVRRNAKWMGLFHHGGTEIRPPMAGTTASPAASGSPAMKASPSASAKPSATIK